MQGDGNVGALDHSSLNQLYQIGGVCVSAGTLGNLQDYGSVLLAASLGNALNDLHVVDVESAHSVATVVSLLEHLGSSNKSHVDSILSHFHGEAPHFYKYDYSTIFLYFNKKISDKKEENLGKVSEIMKKAEKLFTFSRG